MERGFRALVENAPDAMVVSRGGVVLYANAAAARLLGHDSADELVGKPLSLPRREGLEVTSKAIDFEGAAADVTYVRDGSERARLHAQLAHADRLTSLGVMAAGVAHEINNPLTFVGLAAEMLSRRVPPSEASLVKDVRSGIDRIAAIVRDLRFFGRHEDEPQGAVDLAVAIESAERLVSHEIRARAELTKDFAELPAVVGVARRVEQVFVNLLLNAALAVENERDAHITISAQTTTDRVIVTVRDNGVGIAPDKLDRIFEPFFTTRAQGGTGLGLSICRDIVVRAGGNLVAESTLGEGTTMIVTLQRATKERASLKTIPAPAPVTEGAQMRRILVVDDEPLIVSSLQIALARSGDILGETSPERALALLDGGTFDAIVCDVMMPGMTGIDLHERLAREKPAAASRFVFMTGGTFTSRAREYLDGVTNPCLTKPFELHDLVAAIEEVAQKS